MSAMLVGVLACAATILAGTLSARNGILLLLVMGVLAVAAMSRRPKSVLLFAWIVALTYGKAFFIIQDQSPSGFQGIYWILGDPFLVVLIAMWIFAPRTSGPGPALTGQRLWPWVLPFLAAAFISTLGAARPDWALFELVRILKLVLLVFYLRSNLGEEEWWACVAGLGFSTVAQAILSILQVTLKSTSGGIVGLITGGAESAQAVAQAEAMQGAMGGWFRAYGTIGHPANLATYFLLTIPVLLGVSFALRGRARFWAAVSAILGLAGLACTHSRGPWIFGIVQVGVVAVAMVLFRIVSVKRMLVLAGLAAAIALLLVIRFENFVVERFSRDYSESVDLRSRDNHTAFLVFSDSPFTGVGLNNYATKILEYDPQWDWGLAGAADFQKQFDTRVFVAPHNFYMLILAEMGLVGLLSFAVFILGTLWVGIRAVRQSSGAVKVAMFGLILGILGALVQSAVNFSLWVDPLLFTFALGAGMLANSPRPSGSGTVSQAPPSGGRF
jgi:O-antigen ligase